MPHQVGISNRQTPEEEARDREEHPQLDTRPAEPEDASGAKGEEPVTDRREESAIPSECQACVGADVVDCKIALQHPRIWFVEPT